MRYPFFANTERMKSIFKKWLSFEQTVSIFYDYVDLLRSFRIMRYDFSDMVGLINRLAWRYGKSRYCRSTSSRLRGDPDVLIVE
jgi:hypothetical protein